MPSKVLYPQFCKHPLPAGFPGRMAFTSGRGGPKGWAELKLHFAENLSGPRLVVAGRDELYLPPERDVEASSHSFHLWQRTFEVYMYM